MVNRKTSIWLDAWYGKRKWVFLLLPLMWLFRLIAILRRVCLQQFSQQTLAVPVIIVGNISVGGTGKTPLLIALVKHLQQCGMTPGVISRGYGGQAASYPYILSAASSAQQSGDEPLSIFLQTGCAVCVDADRTAAARALVTAGCDILLSDDGLQHYRLGRSMEIAVIDGQRGFGNGFCLPVGPLREPVSRLRQVDFVVVNSAPKNFNAPAGIQSFHMAIEARHWCSVKTEQTSELSHLAPQSRVHAVAGIGNPQRFYQTLKQLSLIPIEHDFPDHYQYQVSDFHFADNLPIVMTEKDAVKCQSFAGDDWFYLAIGAQLPEAFWQAFDAKLTALTVRHL